MCPPGGRDRDRLGQLAAFLTMAALKLPGMLAMNVGADLGLRDGGWSFAITNDWQDADSYRAYDADEEHNRLRREIFAKICRDVARVQIQLDD
jgi:hypothetical protein